MTKKDQRQREWTNRVADYNASGLTMAAWCKANQVPLEQLKYWTRKLKKIASVEASPTSARFIPLSVTEPASPPIASSLVVRVGPANIALNEGFNPQLLREAVEALRDLC